MVKTHKTEAPKAEDHKDDAKENIIAVAIVLLLIVGIGWWVYARLTYVAPQDTSVVDIPLGNSPMLGNESAPVTVVLFSDFECPFCGQFAREDFPAIKEQYIDTGRVRFVYKNFPLSIHANAQAAAEAAVCAREQEKFWEYHDLLYSHQGDLAREDLIGYAEQRGLDMAAFNSCMDTGRPAEVARDQRIGEQSGVTGTPTFFFDGRKVVGVLSVEEFGREIDK